MKRTISSLLLSAALCAAAQEPAPASAPAAAPRPARRALPPEAFTTPTNFVALVDLDGNLHVGLGTDGAWLPEGWLEEQAAAMQRSLMVGVKAVHGPFPAADVDESDSFGLEPPPLSGARPRETARRLSELLPDAKILVILAEGGDIPPILASPYENWVVMDAGWVKRGGGDSTILADRMGKRIYQALGACCGAAYHPEREAVMRYSPTPASLDDCLSHNFHPLNSNAFSIVARAIGLDPVRLRPRKELIELGLLQPRLPREAPAAPETAQPAEIDKKD